MKQVVDATFDDLTMIGSWVCAEDRRELAVTRDPDNYYGLAEDAMLSPFKKVVLDEVFPTFAFGALPVAEDPTMAAVWGFKTEKGWASVKVVTNYIKKFMVPELRAMGIRRAVCLVHPENFRSQRWLTHLGFYPRATINGLGSEPLLLFQRDEPDAPQRH